MTAAILAGILVLIALGAMLASPGPAPREDDRRTATRRAEGRTAWMRIGGGGGAG